MAREMGLADARLATQDRHTAAHPQQGAQLGVAADHGLPRRPGGRGRRGAAHALRRVACLGGRGEPELRAQAICEPVVHAQRARAVSCGREPSHDVARRGLVQRVELEATPRVGDGELGRRRITGEPHEDVGEPGGLPVARFEHPVGVEVLEQRAAVRRGRGLQRPLTHQPLGLLQVRRAAQPEALTRRDERSGTLRSEGAAQRPGGAAQGRPGARVEDVGPEAGGERPAWMVSRMQGEPGQQLPRATACGRLDAPSMDLRLQRPEEPHVEHVPILRTPTLHGRWLVA
jgi:hypothetical protein